MISVYSLAVLPFSDAETGWEPTFLSEGLTLELIHALSEYSFLHVTSRFSSSRFSSATDLAEIRNKLQVTWLVEGNLLVSGSHLSVAVQLIETENGLIKGSFRETAERENFTVLSENLAKAIARRIRKSTESISLSAQNKPVLPEAAEEYMKGQYLLNRLDSTHWKTMLEHFERSLSLDPSYGRPMIALCHSYTWLTSIGVIDPVNARNKIDHLLQLLFSQNHRISDVYLLQAEKHFWIEWKPVQALDNLSAALELNPSNSAALVMKGLVLFSLGQIEEAMEALFLSERLDPFGENVKYCIGMVYRYTGDFDKAYDFLVKSLEISPLWLAPYFSMVEVLCLQHRFDELKQFIENSRTVPGFENMIPLFRGLGAAYASGREEALSVVAGFISSSPDETIIPPLYYYFAHIYHQLGMKKETLEWIEKGLRFRSSPFLFIHVDCSWDSLSEDPGYRTLLKQSGFPEPLKSPPAVIAKYRKAKLSSDTAQEIKQTLKKVLEDQTLFLDPGLSMTDLAELCSVSVNQLSQYLNGNLGMNFYDFVNRYRLDHFLSILGKKEYRNLTILGLAYESGFNSKTTFNTFFNREMKMTPREYLKKRDLSLSEK